MDPVDELIWQQAPDRARSVLVLDTPELVAPAQERWGSVASFCDVGPETPGWVELRDESVDLSAVDLVLLRLPKSLPGLEEYAQRIAVGCAAGVRLVAGGRIKHMTRGMNEVLGRHFGQVSASLGQRKSRVLHASEPRQTMIDFPRLQFYEELGLELVAFGQTFAQNRIDLGTRLLITVWDQLPAPGDAVDLGCGNGVLSALLARDGHRVSALDNSRAALAATRATAAANQLSIMVESSDGLAAMGDESADLIVCNPPFHIGTTKDSTPALRMLADAARVLRDGGELWAVWNSHLPYLNTLQRVGKTMIISRSRGYLVTRTVRHSTGSSAPRSRTVGERLDSGPDTGEPVGTTAKERHVRAH